MDTTPMRTHLLSPRSRALGGVLAAALLAGGCSLLDTQNPNIIPADLLTTPAAAAAKRLGAITQFGLAKDGDINGGSPNDGSDGQILSSGIIADEFVNPGFIPSRTQLDLRRSETNNAGLWPLFLSLHRARNAAEDAAASLVKVLPAADAAANSGIPEMYALAGYAYVMMAETFCSGVPISRTVNDSIVFGTPLTTAQLTDTAIARFTQALAHPSLTPGDRIHSLASVGLARALVDKGSFAAAATAVANVPTDFLYSTEHATTPVILQNGVALALQQGNFGTEDREGGNGLNFVTANDPRVPGGPGLGADGQTDTWKSTKYAGFDTDVPTADRVEAQLIIAESQLQPATAGARTNARTTLNNLRASRPDLALAPLPLAATQAAAVDQLFRERGFWLFATGHRLGDLRRLVRQYGRGAETVFPTGTYFKGGLTYGTQVTLPIPRQETNNPSFTGCLSANP